MDAHRPHKARRVDRYHLSPPNVFSRYGEMVSFVLWEHEVEVRFFLPRPSYCPGDGIGIRVGLRSQILRVRVSPGAPYDRILVSWLQR
jgi:hypothetical protein